MIVSVKDNKFQIIISSLLGFLFFYVTKNEGWSIGIVLILSFLLREIKIDKHINKLLLKNK